MPRLPIAVVLVLAISAVGCSGKKKDDSNVPAAASTSFSPTAAASAPPVNDAKAAAALTALAGRAAKAAYDASYDFNAVRAKGLLRIVASPPRFRLDISSGPQVLQFFKIDVGTVSCGKQQNKPVVCALVAAPGEKVPDVFDPGVQRLFTDGLDALAANPEGYAIASLPSEASTKTGVPVGTCFHVERLADLEPVSPGTVTPPGQGFESGDYCFDPATAVLTSVRISSGNLTLQKAPTKPSEADFTPPAPPRPLEPGAASAAASPAP